MLHNNGNNNDNNILNEICNLYNEYMSSTFTKQHIDLSVFFNQVQFDYGSSKTDIIGFLCMTQLTDDRVYTMMNDLIMTHKYDYNEMRKKVILLIQNTQCHNKYEKYKLIFNGVNDYSLYISILEQQNIIDHVFVQFLMDNGCSISDKIMTAMHYICKNNYNTHNVTNYVHILNSKKVTTTTLNNKIMRLCVIKNDIGLVEQMYDIKSIDDLLNTSTNPQILECVDKIFIDISCDKITEYTKKIYYNLWSFVSYYRMTGILTLLCSAPNNAIKIDIIKFIAKDNKHDCIQKMIVILLSQYYYKHNYEIVTYLFEQITDNIQYDYSCLPGLFNIYYDSIVKKNESAIYFVSRFNEKATLMYLLRSIWRRDHYVNINRICKLVDCMDENDKKTYLVDCYKNSSVDVEKISYMIAWTVGLNNILYGLVSSNCSASYYNKDLHKTCGFCESFTKIKQICGKYIYVSNICKAKIFIKVMLLIIKTGLINKNLQYIIKYIIIPLVIR